MAFVRMDTQPVVAALVQHQIASTAKLDKETLMGADETFRPIPKVLFQCTNEICEIYMFVPNHYSPCPVCASRGILVEDLSFTTWRQEGM